MHQAKKQTVGAPGEVALWVIKKTVSGQSSSWASKIMKGKATSIQKILTTKNTDKPKAREKEIV